MKTFKTPCKGNTHQTFKALAMLSGKTLCYKKHPQAKPGKATPHTKTRRKTDSDEGAAAAAAGMVKVWAICAGAPCGGPPKPVEGFK